jgi:hypothetical protein
VSLRNDNNFRHDCSQYTDNIKTGKHDEQWLHEAWVAHQKRKRGDYDDFDVQKFERDWGIALPPEHHPKRRCLEEGQETASTTATTTPTSKDNPAEESPDELGGDSPAASNSLTAIAKPTSPAAVSEPHSHHSESSTVGRSFAEVHIANGASDELSDCANAVADTPAGSHGAVNHGATGAGEDSYEPEASHQLEAYASTPDKIPQPAQDMAGIVSASGEEAELPHAIQA